MKRVHQILITPLRNFFSPGPTLHRLRLAVLVSLLAFAGNASAGLKIYYIRHGEAGNNVVKDWQDKPQSTWPSYVGDGNVFTPKGEEQVAAVVEKLKPYHFDFIAVSPYWRARHTILPYLKATNQKAEIWPEMGELGSQGSWETLPDKSSLPEPSANLFAGTKDIKLTADESAYFTLREGDTREFRAASHVPNQAAVNEHAIIGQEVNLIKKLFGGSDKSLLLVGHGNQGIQLLKELTNYTVPLPPKIDNTGIWMVEEQLDGSFKLETFNDSPFQAP